MEKREIWFVPYVPAHWVVIKTLRFIKIKEYECGKLLKTYWFRYYKNAMDYLIYQGAVKKEGRYV